MNPLPSTAPRNSLEDPLLNLGFTDKEARVYLALLELGPSPVREISLKSGLKKPTTYVILEGLIEKDAARFIPGAKKKLYSAESPDDIFETAKQRLNKAFFDLPRLKSLGSEGSKKTVVTCYEGASEYEQAMRYKEAETMSAGETACYFSKSHDSSPVMLKRINEYMARLAENKVRVRGFAQTPETPEHADDAGKTYGWDIKNLPSSAYSANSSIEINQTFVRFTLFEQNVFVIIENPEIAKAMRQIFEMNWGNVGFYQKMLGGQAARDAEKAKVNTDQEKAAASADTEKPLNKPSEPFSTVA